MPDMTPATIAILSLAVLAFLGIATLLWYGVRFAIAHLLLKIHEVEAKAAAAKLEKARTVGHLKQLHQDQEMAEHRHLNDLSALKNKVEHLEERLTNGGGLPPEFLEQAKALYSEQERLTSEIRTQSLGGHGRVNPEVLDDINGRLSTILAALAGLENQRSSTVPMANMEAALQGMANEMNSLGAQCDRILTVVSGSNGAAVDRHATTEHAVPTPPPVPVEVLTAIGNLASGLKALQGVVEGYGGVIKRTESRLEDLVALPQVGGQDHFKDSPNRVHVDFSRKVALGIEIPGGSAVDPTPAGPQASNHVALSNSAPRGEADHSDDGSAGREPSSSTSAANPHAHPTPPDPTGATSPSQGGSAAPSASASSAAHGPVLQGLIDRTPKIAAPPVRPPVSDNPFGSEEDSQENPFGKPQESGEISGLEGGPSPAGSETDNFDPTLNADMNFNELAAKLLRQQASDARQPTEGH